ncbi:MAG: HAMP domain-containing histidine kinase [Dehalococcoidia bacterium]|nr:HAMP domain-containing histidine kinase [Dehalococcoidia bacterium]
MKNQTTIQREQLPNSAKQTLELIAFLTYEFKSQLNSINTSVSLLAEKLANSHNDFETKLIGNIMASHHYLEARTSELLALVKLQVDGFHLELELTDIDDIVHRVIDQLSSTISNREQSLTLSLAPNTKKIIADSLRIEQVLHNLLSNASKSTPAGGNISISTDKQAGYIVIKVRDSGRCIPSLDQREIFQPYCCLTGDKDTQIHGIRLGPALCKYLVELHGGRIWVENEENNGNTFALTLPLNNN